MTKLGSFALFLLPGCWRENRDRPPASVDTGPTECPLGREPAPFSVRVTASWKLGSFAQKRHFRGERGSRTSCPIGITLATVIELGSFARIARANWVRSRERRSSLRHRKTVCRRPPFAQLGSFAQKMVPTELGSFAPVSVSEERPHKQRVSASGGSSLGLIDPGNPGDIDSGFAILAFDRGRDAIAEFSRNSLCRSDAASCVPRIDAARTANIDRNETMRKCTP